MLTEQNAASINKYMDMHEWICRLTEDNRIHWGELVTEFIRYTSYRATHYKYLYDEELKKKRQPKEELVSEPV